MPTSDWCDQHDLCSGKHHRTGMNVQIACTTGTQGESESSASGLIR
ncbi:hypothetical protein [uncultured Amnibacterium sp.]